MTFPGEIPYSTDMPDKRRLERCPESPLPVTGSIAYNKAGEKIIFSGGEWVKIDSVLEKS